MRKLKLDPEMLTVATFEADARDEALRGTIDAHAMASNNTDPVCCKLTIRTCASFEFSCRAEGEL
jgi:hypothetical protein